MSRTVHLDVNDSGSWKRMASFDLDWLQDGDLEHCAHELLCLADNPKLKARIIATAETAPLLTWTKSDGWREWRMPA